MNTKLLNETIERKGLRVKYLWENMGITCQAFSKKRKGERAFTAREVEVLSDLLGLDTMQRRLIFFPELVSKTDTK